MLVEGLPELPDFLFKGQPLTREQSGHFMSLYMNKESEEALQDSKLANEFLSQVLLKRVRALELPFTFTDFFLIMSIDCFVDRPGMIIILLRLCYQLWKDKGVTHFGIDQWAIMFPFGCPSAQDLDKYWDSQKFVERKSPASDNLLDYSCFWK